MPKSPSKPPSKPSSKTLFLPGASGHASFWKPVADRARLDGVFFSWPGLGTEPSRPGIAGIEDLVALVAREITEPVNIIAQSMGGLIALKLALSRPGSVERLVLAVTSGGVPVADLGGADWRFDYFTAFPNAARWIADPVCDLSSRIPMVKARTLLLWGGADPLSPVAVGKRLLTLLPNARLRVFPDAGHDLAQTHVDAVAAEIGQHLIDDASASPR
ncbi:MAG TPA: alpha/beta hydrolase [Methylorubrum populi]|uniref:Alpha/beta hydrolase n=1 Tax=Methylorubrum populi TaxID=223967 RepID=A0A921DZF8_9HYPH|nr:alpha/beta hydrolase [Methylorubrum populi]